MYPLQVYDADSSTFTKLPQAEGTEPVACQPISGEFLDRESLSAEPSEFAALSCHPNPCNPEASIRFVLPEAGQVNVTVFDISGKQEQVLTDGWREAGYHEVIFNGSNFASSLYFYWLTTGNFGLIQKMVLVK